MAGFAAALASAVSFGFLARAVMANRTVAFDNAVRDTIHGWAGPALTWVMRLVTQFGSMPVLLPLGALLVWRLYMARRPRAAVILALTTVGSQLFDQWLKFGFQRQRPAVFFGLPQPSNYSFPSGHSVTSCCFYGVLAAILSAGAVSRRRKAVIWIAAALITLAIGFSRVYLGVHYPTDVLGGYLLAVAWVGIVRAAYEFWLPRARK